MESGSLHDRLFLRHKVLFTSVVIPVMTGTTVILIAVYWKNSARFYSALLGIVLLDVFNIFFSIRSRIIRTPLGTFDSRSDGFDTFRWCVNLPADVYILASLGASFASTSFIWLVMTFGCFAEVYHPRNRIITFCVAVVCFAFLMNFLEADWPSKIYVFSCYLGLSFILFRFERWIVSEMEAFHEAEQAKLNLLSEATLLRREAMIGSQTRTICHEINNMLTVMQASVARLNRNQSTSSSESVVPIEQLERALRTLARVSQIVLRDIGSGKATERDYPVEQLFQDFKLLLEKQFAASSEYDFTLSLATGPSLEGATIREWSGATYLIVHNLTKNAVEATEAISSLRRRAVKISGRLEPEAVVVTVEDNGPGLSIELWNSICANTFITTKAAGNGLGIRFILDQIEKNGMALEFGLLSEGGTVFTLRVPLVAANEKISLAA